MKKKIIKIKKGPLAYKKWLLNQSSNYRRLAETREEDYPDSKPYFLERADIYHRLAYKAKS